MTTDPSHHTTQKKRTSRDADGGKDTRTPLSAAAERLLAMLLQRDMPASPSKLARPLHEPVLRRILSILEGPAGEPTQEERQRTAASAEEVLSRIDVLAYGEGGSVGRKKVFLALVETYALLSFAQDGVPPEPGMPIFDAQAIATELAAIRVPEPSVAEGMAPTVVISHGDARYPKLLRSTPARDQPRFLHCQGDVALLATPCISIVGSRNATPLGLALTHQLAARLASDGYTIVSGLARGIDTAAHEGALSVGGRTVAVLGTSLSRTQCFPRSNALLEDRIVAEDGLLASEYAEGSGSSARFKARDRIIAAIGLVVIPIQAERQSGTLVTAHRAQQYGRPIWCLRPPPEESQAQQYQGIHDLIAGGSCHVFPNLDDTALLDEIQRLAKAALS